MPIAKICGTEINYQLSGEGEETLVILNGILMSVQSWAHTTQAFARAGFRVLCLDFRDQGASGASDRPYTIEQHADDLKALLDYLGIAKCHLLGLSYGGQVAMIFALHYGDYIDKLILTNTSARLTPHLRALAESWAEAAKLKDGVRFFRLVMPSIYSAPFYARSYEWLLEREENMGAALDESWFERYLRLSKTHGKYDLTQQVQRIKLPTLLISGAEDNVTPYEEIRFLHGAIEGSLCVVIPDCGHTVCYEKPAEFHLAVVGFLKT